MSQDVGGSISVSFDCIADLAGYAALECYGVVGMAATDAESGLVRILPFNRLRRGIGVSAVGTRVTVDLHVILQYGINMSLVCSNLVSSVKFILAHVAGLDDVVVHVHIDDLRMG